MDMHGCTHVCGMNFQNFFWIIESLHQRTLIRIQYEFFLLFFLKKFDFSCFVLTRVCTVYGWLITGLLNFGHFLSQLFSDSFKNHLIIHTLIDFLSLINLQKDCTFLSLTNYLVFTTQKNFMNEIMLDELIFRTIFF